MVSIMPITACYAKNPKQQDLELIMLDSTFILIIVGAIVVVASTYLRAVFKNKEETIYSIFRTITENDVRSHIYKVSLTKYIAVYPLKKELHVYDVWKTKSISDYSQIAFLINEGIRADLIFRYYVKHPGRERKVHSVTLVVGGYLKDGTQNSYEIIYIKDFAFKVKEKTVSKVNKMKEIKDLEEFCESINDLAEIEND